MLSERSTRNPNSKLTPLRFTNRRLLDRGKTPRMMANDLNKRGVRPPRRRPWNASTINGNVSRGGGLILNDLYAGRIIWNKVRMIKDPVTRKRLSRPNPKDQYKIVEAPHLRIVDDATFRRAPPRRHTGDRAKGPRAEAGLFRVDQVRFVRRRHGVNRQRRERSSLAMLDA
jgi:hypothetical protein